MFLIVSPNVINFIGLRWFGLVSYLLVIYYRNGAEILTVLSNRIGDVTLLMVTA
jgi:NADH:ubiquinone oxidoreductase subunit 5 (subunit L)/multisubunit Na+/H+ antiporter MnhA subunit